MKNVTFEEKYNTVIKALYEAKMITPSGSVTKLYIVKQNGLIELIPQEIIQILQKLKDEEGILEEFDIPSKMKGLALPQSEILYPKVYFEVIFTDKFEEWYTAFLIRENSEIEYLETYFFYDVMRVLSHIKEKLQVNNKSKVTVDFIKNFGEVEAYDQWQIDDLCSSYYKILTYLKSIGVLKDFATNSSNVLYSEVNVDVPRFFTVMERAEARDMLFRGNKPEQPTRDDKKSDSSPDYVYEITYTPNREVCLNGSLVLSKPNFNGENDLVMHYLVEHTNEIVTKVDLEEAIKSKITKSFHKIIENLGFKGDLKKIFFEVSEDAVVFRNPITQEVLNAMGIIKPKL